MPSNNGFQYQQTMVWDEVHILTVNHHRNEMFLSQNVGGVAGELHIKEPNTVIRADLRDPLRVLDMAVRYAIRFDLLARALDSSIVTVLEQIGMKDFLEKTMGAGRGGGKTG